VTGWIVAAGAVGVAAGGLVGDGEVVTMDGGDVAAGGDVAVGGGGAGLHCTRTAATTASVPMRQTPISEHPSPHTSRHRHQLMTLPERMVLANSPLPQPWKSLCRNKIGHREVG
jgi:hypothetical protein